MFFNLFLIILFAGSMGALWRRISEKIPELVAIPDEVIVARLHEDSARVRIFLLHAKTFWREPRYRIVFWRFCEKICYRIHIIFLKMDNGLMALVKKVRSYADSAGIKEQEGDLSPEASMSISEEKQEVADEVFVAAALPPRAGIRHSETHPHTIISPSDRPTRVIHSRIQEVRRKKKEKILPG